MIKILDKFEDFEKEREKKIMLDKEFEKEKNRKVKDEKFNKMLEATTKTIKREEKLHEELGNYHNIKKRRKIKK
jgi:hypothetical protein